MYQNKIEKTLKILFDACQGDMTQIDRGYLEALDFTYPDGDVCRISDFSENIDVFNSFEEFLEWVSPLIKGNPEEEGFNMEFAEADDEEMLKQVIGTIYLEGVANVSDKNRKKLSEENNYGFNIDKNQWEGFFQGVNGKVFSYTISKKGGKWGIEYKLA